MMSLLLLSCFAVTVGPGWSEPFVVTDSANTTRREQFLYRDEIGRNHLIWAGFNDESRIAYKMFSTDGGTELYPETMISRDVSSPYLSPIVTIGDSLYAFWREGTPVYTAARSIADGSQVLPATYLFTNSTWMYRIRTSPDSLGRLHVLYNGGFEGAEVFYAVWSPSPDSGFTTEYEWIVEGAEEDCVLLVDGNRVHVVVKNKLDHHHMYTQYDLEGNTVVPQYDFTENDYLWARYPELEIDSEGNLLIVALVNDPNLGYTCVLWRIHGETGELLTDYKPLILPEPPSMDVGSGFNVSPLPDLNTFYLCWHGYSEEKIFYKVFDAEGNTVLSWQLAYDYSDEDPEDIGYLDGCSDDEGNFYLIFSQGETEPYLGAYPTFGWFDYSTLGIEDSTSGISRETPFTVSQNPVTGSVTVFSEIDSPIRLRVFDLTGREVSSISVLEGVGVWNGTGFSGERLPAGVYSITDNDDFSRTVTLLNE
ncbi:MAG TPA: hypothetical protein PK991_05115 [Candidatus Sabulitectum sp.]|nr:hypothetical protein [Candidatus Sabulitectum sp.]